MGRQVLVAGVVLLAMVASAAGQTARYSTWMGGPGADRFTSAAVMPDGTVVLGGVMPNNGDADKDPKLPASAKITGRGEGILVRLAPQIGVIPGALRFLGAISDIDADESGNLYIATATGSLRLDVRGRILWNNDIGGPGSRITAGPSGSAIILSDKTITVISPYGTANKKWKVEADAVLDIACDPVEQLAYVTGYDTRTTADGKSLEVAFVYAYDGSGKIAWKAYGWTAAELSAAGLAANTRGLRLLVGADHKVYVVGQGAGGANLWARQSQDLAKPASLIKADKYQDAADAGAAVTVGFIARLDTKTGRSEAGTFLVARNGDKPASLRLRDLAVGEAGRIFVAGDADADPPISDRAFGDRFEGSGAFFVMFDMAFRRQYAAKLCRGQANAVAVGQAGILVAGEGTKDLALVKPFQKEFGGGDSDGWMVFFSAPASTNLPTPAVSSTVTPMKMPIIGPMITPTFGSIATPSLGPVTTPSLGPVTTPTFAPIVTPTLAPKPLLP
jgi:hypothetical protein